MMSLACETSHSQTSLAVGMSRQSSPRGSPSYLKLQQILSQHKHFHIDLGGTHQGLFDVVAQNMGAALQGYGLNQVLVDNAESDDFKRQEGMIRVEALFSPHRKTRGDMTEPLYLHQPNMAVIILQTEQICCTPYGKSVLPYLQLCHASPNCILWEYAPTNLQWLQQQGIADSTVLLPILHQHRLNTYYASASTSTTGTGTGTGTGMLPLHQRPIDVVFFGVMTPRRKQLQAQLNQIAQQQEWNLVLQEVENSGSRLDYMANAYQNAKVCLIIHSFFADKNPGEYHRLAELAPSGCVPVVETFGDVLFWENNKDQDNSNKTNVMEDYYGHCGGVIFATLHELVPSIQAVLFSIRHDSSNHKNSRLREVLGDSMPDLASKVENLPPMQDRLNWWNQPVQWDRILSIILLDDHDNHLDGDRTGEL
ncbi:expressed unknown protein [Seminavis robusta]|uniref:Uncharacterized protein n=1 Tax=Seminavis robusta TaxID=568900 RepID=A0A9N8GZD9_9STRA|nr:expressed unknown protein [Seminavis robusta]|eukprot:Sro3_g001980.1 n/a (423) ;mRNA; f:14315-15583